MLPNSTKLKKRRDPNASADSPAGICHRNSARFGMWFSHLVYKKHRIEYQWDSLLVTWKQKRTTVHQEVNLKCRLIFESYKPFFFSVWKWSSLLRWRGMQRVLVCWCYSDMSTDTRAPWNWLEFTTEWHSL